MIKQSIPYRVFFVSIVFFLFSSIGYGQDEDYEFIDEDSCIDCHDEAEHGVDFELQIEDSIHDGLGCLDCHPDMDTDPHNEDSDFNDRADGCAECHEDESEEFKGHGSLISENHVDTPSCSDCHGGHDILSGSDEDSRIYPANLSNTCGNCHEDIDLTTKHSELINHPIEIFKTSIHASTLDGGNPDAPTCLDCHSTNGTAHQIYNPGNIESKTNYFNIPSTCGKCHEEEEDRYWEGIHGQLTSRGEVNSPVCTKCHGEHGILSPDDPNSPVSPAHMAEAICAPCHDAPLINAKYGLPPGEQPSYIDRYHGLKTKIGDADVATCGSCHGNHKILPSSDSLSTTFKGNLVKTCGECHEGIAEKVAVVPIHNNQNKDIRTPIARIIEKIYILSIIFIIGLMVIHWIIDIIKQIINVTRKPQVRRMQRHEVWQHTFLMVSFTILALSGFALRFNQSWLTTFFFGWNGGFALRGVIHRIAAVIFTVTVIWHSIYIIFYLRGRAFLKAMIPEVLDFRQFFQRISYNFGLRGDTPKFKRFSYIEKAEYWALVWGTAVMIITGIFLWWDNYFIEIFPESILDISLVVHYWEAWLATLAILIWHLYSTIFNPHTYPMNPSWMTGKMPKDMYEHEHPEHIDEAIKEEKELTKEKNKSSK